TEGARPIEAAFSPDGNTMAVLARGLLFIWEVPVSTSRSIELAKHRTQRCLTSQERERAFLDIEPPEWCVEQSKWPFAGESCKKWVDLRRKGSRPPIPTPEEWEEWVTNHSSNR